MAAHALRNGLKLTAVTVSATPANAAGSFVLVPGSQVGTPSRPGLVRMSSSSFVDPTTGKATAAAYQFNGTAKATGFSAAALADNDVRVMQFVRINDYSVTYAGRKDSDGMVDWHFKAPLHFTWHLDCITDPQATAAVNYPYYDASTTIRSAATYFPLLQDTPSTNLDLDMWNGKTSRNNFLWRFASDALFMTYLVFVHKDGSREPLEGVVWRLDREFMCQWIGGKPDAATSKLTSTLTIVEKNKVLKSDHALFKLMVDAGSTPVMNVASNGPMKNLRSSPAVQFDELEHYWADFDDTFWK